MSSERAMVCVAAIGGMTACIKAQHILLDHGISASVIALSPRETRRGCAYGISYPCVMERQARMLLQGANIPVSQFFTKESNAP